MDAADAAFLDEDFQECWWCVAQEGHHVFTRGWATRQGERALVYIAGGDLWAGTQETYRELHRQISQEVKSKREAGTLAVSRRYEATKKGAGEYLRSYRCDTGVLPSRSTWKNAWRGGKDAGGRQITVELTCASCRTERVAGLIDADLLTSVFYENGFRCSLLRGVSCNDRTPLPKGSVYEFALTGTRGVPTTTGALQTSTDIPVEVSRDTGEGGDVEVVGFSAAAKQFYKARGPQLHTPTYRGEPSEVDLLAWKRGIEKYFETYGVTRSREKVSLAADLLEGEAAKWWNGLWMSGRDGTVSTWDELIEKLRERFLPPEGEMRVVGQWRRLQQTGSVAAYADYVFRLKALCDMGESAEFKLAFFGLQPELQAEVRKYLRQNRLRQLELEKLFAVAQDAEVGLTGRGGRKGFSGQEVTTEKTGAKKFGAAGANTVMLDAANEATAGAKKGSRQPEKRSDGNDRGVYSNRGSTNSSWKSGGTSRMDYSRNDQSSWGRSRGSASTGTGGRSAHDRSYDTGGGALCFICDKTGHGWFNCPQKKGGKGCFRCGSESHQFSRCPQRQGDKHVRLGHDKVNRGRRLVGLLCFIERDTRDGSRGSPCRL